MKDSVEDWEVFTYLEHFGNIADVESQQPSPLRPQTETSPVPVLR